MALADIREEHCTTESPGQEELRALGSRVKVVLARAGSKVWCKGGGVRRAHDSGSEP